MHIPKHIQEVFKRATCLYTKTEIETALDKMAIELNAVFADKNPIILCVMIGGLVPVGNLLPRLDFPMELHYIHATRYQGGLSGKELTWKSEPYFSLQGRTVLIIDDILDGGATLNAIYQYCKKEAEAVFTAVLVDKDHPRETNGLAHADFTALTVDDHYIFGYGMDYKEYLRNAPGIYVVAPEDEN